MTNPRHTTTLPLNVGAIVLLAPSSAADDTQNATCSQQDAAYRRALASPRRYKSRRRLELELHSGGVHIQAAATLSPHPWSCLLREATWC